MHETMLLAFTRGPGPGAQALPGRPLRFRETGAGVSHGTGRIVGRGRGKWPGGGRNRATAAPGGAASTGGMCCMGRFGSGSSSDVIGAYPSFPGGARPPCKRLLYDISPRLTLVRLLGFRKKLGENAEKVEKIAAGAKKRPPGSSPSRLRRPGENPPRRLRGTPPRRVM